MKNKGTWMVAVAWTLASCIEGDAGIAQSEADAWAKSMGIEGPVVCAKQDSDGDGYVSCTFKDGHGVEAVECATGHGCSKGGCRIPKPQPAGQSPVNR